MLHTLWVRHGESQWNRLGLMQGQTAWPALTETGVEQARAAAEHLAAGDRPRRLFSSDLLRAAQTARIIGERLGLPVECTPLLRERCWGVYEGRPVGDGQRAEAALPATARLPQGESRQDVARRLRRLLRSGISEGPVVLVTHGDVLREAAELWTGCHLGHDGPAANGAVLRIAM